MSVNFRGKCNSCCVPGCNSNSTPSFRNRGGRITTFKLPRDDKRRKEWIHAIPKRKYPPTVNHNVCILHFNEEDFSRNNRRIDLKKSAVPSIFPFVNGQTTDESADIRDEVWTEYVAYKRDSNKMTFEQVDNELPAPTSDISRILIERLRIPGSKYFGIDTAEITIEPDSDFESDFCESNDTMKSGSTTKKKNKKKIKCDEEGNASSSVEFDDHFDELDMIDSPSTAQDDADNKQIQIKQFSIESVTVPDSEDKFGTMVGSKLLLMTPLQRLMSEKIISEILLKGQLGMLKSSLSPVLVTGYMKNLVKNSSNGITNTTDAATTDDMLSMDDDSGDKDSDSGDSDDCDPLMCQVKQEAIRDAKLESVDFVKDEICWSDDDDD